MASWDRLDGSLPEHSRFSLEQLYFPPGLGTILAQAPGANGPGWFGAEKKEMLRHWKSWLTIFIMSEDNNEGVFGPPPPTGNSVRISQQMLGRGALSYQPTAETLRGWCAPPWEFRQFSLAAKFCTGYLGGRCQVAQPTACRFARRHGSNG